MGPGGGIWERRKVTRDTKGGIRWGAKKGHGPEPGNGKVKRVRNYWWLAERPSPEVTGDSA